MFKTPTYLLSKKIPNSLDPYGRSWRSFPIITVIFDVFWTQAEMETLDQSNWMLCTVFCLPNQKSSHRFVTELTEWSEDHWYLPLIKKFVSSIGKNLQLHRARNHNNKLININCIAEIQLCGEKKNQSKMTNLSWLILLAKCLFICNLFVCQVLIIQRRRFPKNRK